MASTTTFRSPLHEMTQTTPSVLWNDSAALDELEYSISHGAVGATCNPVIVLDVLKREMGLWKERIAALVRDMPRATEGQIAWALVEEISATRAKLFDNIFELHKGRNGRLSIQTDPRYYRDPGAIVAQALRFHALAPNMIVKIPATAAGIVAMEEATAAGVSINATVSFTLPQAVAVAQAVERGLARREAAGHDISAMGPVCTIMVGRLDDWLKVLADKHQITIEPGHLEWAGVEVFKRSYKLFQQRGYRVRLLAAAFRNHMHWIELVGGDVVISPPCGWQKRFNASGLSIQERIHTPVDPKIVEELSAKFPDFVRAATEGGLSVPEFDTFGPTVRTLRQFLDACHELEKQIREFMLPSPDRN